MYSNFIFERRSHNEDNYCLHTQEHLLMVSKFKSICLPAGASEIPDVTVPQRKLYSWTCLGENKNKAFILFEWTSWKNKDVMVRLKQFSFITTFFFCITITTTCLITTMLSFIQAACVTRCIEGKESRRALRQASVDPAAQDHQHPCYYHITGS